MKGSQEVVDFVAARLREQTKDNGVDLERICEEVKMFVIWGFSRLASAGTRQC